MPGAGRAATLLLVQLALVGCATRRAAVSWPSPAPASYSAAVRGSLTWKGRGLAISGGCAVDPARGARLEVRDAFGGTRLLFLLRPDQARLLDISRGISCSWSEASEEVPWSPEDIWLLFTGRPPVQGLALSAVGGGPAETSRWHNGAGSLKARLGPSAQGPAPFDSAALVGPGASGLTLAFSRARTSSFPDEAFSEPPGISFAPASMRTLLEGLEH